MFPFRANVVIVGHLAVGMLYLLSGFIGIHSGIPRGGIDERKHNLPSGMGVKSLRTASPNETPLIFFVVSGPMQLVPSFLNPLTRLCYNRHPSLFFYKAVRLIHLLTI